MNPTNWGCPTDICAYDQTDWRPSKALYENVTDNNKFRHFLQNTNVRLQNSIAYTKTFNCACEGRPSNHEIVPFDSSSLDSLANGVS